MLWPWKIRELAEKESEDGVFKMLRSDVTRFLTTIPIGTTPVAWLSLVLYPVGRVVTYLSMGMLKALGLKGRSEPYVTEDELKLMLRGAELSGAIEEEEHDMIENVLEIKDTHLREVMTPLVDVVAIDARASLVDFHNLWVTHQYSRVPVFEQRVDNIVGIAYAMDMLDYVPKGELQESISVGDMAHKPAYFVPESMAWDTTEEKLRDYFNNYSEVSQAVIMRDKTTGRPRGFGFVVFSDPFVLDLSLHEKHTIDGRTVEAKRALSREEQHNSRSGNLNSSRGSEGGGNFKTKKIFVGGLPTTLTEDGFRQYFESYGHVTDVVVMYDQNTQRPGGFGFITFDSEDAVDRVLHKTFHELMGKRVEVKRVLPKDANSGGGSRGGGYQGYGASSVNNSTFDGRIDGNRFMQPQSTAGGFPSYLGYGAPGYGYGAAGTGVGYGGYGGYGIVGYGGAGTGFGGPTGAYGNSNAGYMSAAPGALKGSWGNQTPSGYGASGYDSGSAVSAPTGQSPAGASGYGNQGYGYGNYGGIGGPYSGGYGAASERAGSGARGEQGSGYGDSNGNSGSNSSDWRSFQHTPALHFPVERNLILIGIEDSMLFGVCGMDRKLKWDRMMMLCYMIVQGDDNSITWTGLAKIFPGNIIKDNSITWTGLAKIFPGNIIKRTSWTSKKICEKNEDISISPTCVENLKEF
ncbi:hypothetical protein Q3G72_000948 [Acer saccharum]|nr:hypothetical protein Q3G72_000948 [Acer saccharum]